MYVWFTKYNILKQMSTWNRGITMGSISLTWPMGKLWCILWSMYIFKYDALF